MLAAIDISSRTSRTFAMLRAFNRKTQRKSVKIAKKNRRRSEE